MDRKYTYRSKMTSAKSPAPTAPIIDASSEQQCHGPRKTAPCPPLDLAVPSHPYCCLIQLFPAIVTSAQFGFYLSLAVVVAVGCPCFLAQIKVGTLYIILTYVAHSLGHSGRSKAP